MFKKFLNGLVFGAGFGIAFIVVVVIYFQFFFSPMVESKISVTNKEIGEPPNIKEEKRYLGSPAIYSGGFLDNKGGVLSGGPGEIVGKATLNDNPVVGLKLRLALNGSAMSQWAITDTEGLYIVNVPYGEYRIDGFELDTETANSILAGKIDNPQSAHSSSKFEVTKDNKGRGLSFKFVDPIEKKFQKRKFTTKEDIVINWAPYPGASEYSVQIYEKADPHAYIGNSTLFEWSQKPRVSSTSFSLKEHGIHPKAGYYYVVEIDARDERMGIISQTHRMHSGYDFEVVE